MSKTLEHLKEYRKKCLKDLYNQCTPPQQDLFKRMYKNIDEISDSKIDWAIQQCENTIAKNKEKRNGKTS